MPTTIEKPKDLSIAAVSRRATVDPATVWRWIRRGITVSGGRKIRLAAHKVGGVWRVTPDALDEFIAATTAASMPDDAGDAPRSPAEHDRAAALAGAKLEALGI